MAFGEPFVTPRNNIINGVNLQYGADGPFTLADWTVYAGSPQGYTVRASDFFVVTPDGGRINGTTSNDGQFLAPGQIVRVVMTFNQHLDRRVHLAYGLGGPVAAVWDGNNFDDHLLSSDTTSTVPAVPSLAPVPPDPATDSAGTGCTTTRSGSCIQGGEFCRVAAEGTTGTDDQGHTYMCTDVDNNGHPHWVDY